MYSIFRYATGGVSAKPQAALDYRNMISVASL